MSAPSFLGSLANFANYDATPHIGTVFSDPAVQLTQLLTAPNSDVLIKDLATLVSQRGVVFFKTQDIAIGQQKELATRLGELTGKPADSKLHRHPLTEDGSELGDDVQVISSAVFVFTFLCITYVDELGLIFFYVHCTVGFPLESGHLLAAGGIRMSLLSLFPLIMRLVEHPHLTVLCPFLCLQTMFLDRS